MTFEASRLIVLMTQPPQPRSKLLAITRPLVPGGPLARMKGFSNSIPWTVVLRVGLAIALSLHGLHRLAEGLQALGDLVLGDVQGGGDPDGVVVEAALADQEPPLL